MFLFILHIMMKSGGMVPEILSLDVSYDQKLITFCQFMGHSFSWYFCGVRICLLCFNQSHPFFFIGWLCV